MTVSPHTLPVDPTIVRSPMPARRVPTEPLDELAAKRAAAAAALDDCTDRLILGIKRELDAGRDVNILALAKAANIARQTIYTRLDELGVQR